MDFNSDYSKYKEDNPIYDEEAACLWIHDWIMENLIDEEVDEDLALSILGFISKRDLWPIFQTLADWTYLTPKAYGQALNYVYVMSEWFPEEVTDYFANADLDDIMSEDEYKFYKTLPKRVTIYRGTDKTEADSKDYKPSWTLDIDVAKKFASRHSDVAADQRVLKATVSKQDIKAYFGSRSEAEIIVIENLNKVEVLKI